jgi:hypothetical protein
MNSPADFDCIGIEAVSARSVARALDGRDLGYRFAPSRDFLRIRLPQRGRPAHSGVLPLQ